MSNQKIRVLMIIEQCNPDWSSVPLVGYNFYNEIIRYVDVTLITHHRNREALERKHPDRRIVYASESEFIKKYYKVAEKLSQINGKIIWPLYNALIYPVYGEFNHTVYEKFENPILNGEYDIVHSITPMMPRYPVKLVKVCHKTPLIIGPVNGGVPYPKGFREVASQEFAYFNFLRFIGRFLIPEYHKTYHKAAMILAGSSYTKKWIREVFNVSSERLMLFYENGISSSFLRDVEEVYAHDARKSGSIRLLFVGRLVPYKGTDMLIEAIHSLSSAIKRKISLTIVGDGSERQRLEQQVRDLDLDHQVRFVGWVPQAETRSYYRNSDIFCFPSIREFGGAVVLEAMASGLPCIVVDNGGIGEYITGKEGFKIEPESREFVVLELTKYIEQLVEDSKLRQEMSVQAIQRSREFTWTLKGEEIVKMYHEILAKPVQDTKNSSSNR